MMLQVSELSASLAHDSTVQILALKVDNAITERWTRNTLASLSYPYIAALPAKEASVYRLAHKLASKKGLLLFMNRTFRRSGSNCIVAQEPSATVVVQAAPPPPPLSTLQAGRPSILHKNTTQKPYVQFPFACSSLLLRLLDLNCAQVMLPACLQWHKPKLQ
jgi:hypothetical protein